MRLNSNNSLLLVVLLLVMCTVPTSQHSCWTLLTWDWIRNPTWQRCHQSYSYNGHTVGHSHGSLRACWFGQCADGFNYNTVGYVYSYNYGYGNWYYGPYGEACDHYYGECNGKTRLNGWWSNGRLYYDYEGPWNWYSSPLTVDVYSPCHKRCGTCNSAQSWTNCLTCQHTYEKVYLWQNVSGGSTYTRCDTTCLVRTDNVATGQYIRNVNDLVCSLCNSTCSRCEDLNNGAYCRTCVTGNYLLIERTLCRTRFPNDLSHCAPTDYICVPTCPANLYFPVEKANTLVTANDWSKYNGDWYVSNEKTSVCYPCHRFCITCTAQYDYTCSRCSNGFYKWQQYGPICSFFCPEGDYSTKVGQFIDATYSYNPPSGMDYSTYRQCVKCHNNCSYCAGTSQTCYMCMDTHFLLDDRQNCLNTFNCSSCNVSDGCASRDKYCRITNCPEYFYFPLGRQTASSSDSATTNPKYFLFINATVMNTSNNGYIGQSANDSRTLNSQEWPRFEQGNVNYRYYTNICKMCDYRCMKCFGPTNFQCTSCVNRYYKWTNASTCESYCPIGQYQRDIDGSSSPTNETTCANCDAKCQNCKGYSTNCSLCVVFPNANYAFLYNYVLYNSTCMATCPSASALSPKGYYGSIGSMQCHPCPGGCQNCNINYLITYYTILQTIICAGDSYCSKGVICTSCLAGYSLVGGMCVSQNSCRLYSYYVQGNSSSAWSPSNCYCLEGYYFSASMSCSNCHISCLTCNGGNSNNCVTCPQGFVVSSGSCAQSQVVRNDYWILSGTSLSSTATFGNNYDNYTYCGSYYTLFGYRSAVNTGSHFYHSSITYATPNFYAISIRMKVLFIDNWEGTAGLYFRLNSASAYPFAIYNYNNFGAIGEMQCGTNAQDYLLTVSAKLSVSPTGGDQYNIYVNHIKDPEQNSTGFYYYWGIHDAVFTVLRCDSSCATCTGPATNQCKTCSDGAKIVVNGTCVCNVASNYYYTLGSAISSGCQWGCPYCNYSSGSNSNWCYYRDNVQRACVNPPTNNCSSPYSYGQPYEIYNSYGTCVQNCSSGYYAIQSLMKCTTNCAQWGLYYYRSVSSFGYTMNRCVSKCPSGLIANPNTMWCVTRCPSSPMAFLMLENRDTDPKCTTNCPTGWQYDNTNECVNDCPAGYFKQTLSGHNRCVKVCTNAFGDNITLSCLLSCPTPSWADPTTQLCVNTCPNGSYPQIKMSNANRTCVTQCQAGQWLHPYYQNCTKNPLDCPLGTYADNNTKKCEYRCTVLGEVGQNTTRMCQTACNTGFAYWDIGVCVSICPTNPSMFSYLSGNTRICVSSCNSIATGLYGDVQASRSCIANCSALPQATFGDNSTNLCVKKCPVSNQYGDPNHPNRQCVTWCSFVPNQTYYFQSTKMCVSPCPDGYYGDNSTTTSFGLCSTSCNLPYYGDPVNNLCVLKCPYGYYGSQIGAHLCVRVCPSGWYGINGTSNRVCVQTCDSGYWADGFTRMCYNIKTMCSNNTYADAQARLCVNGTLCTSGTYADPSTMGCQAACTNASMFGDPSTRLCVSMCPASPDYYSEGGYCKATCTENRYADWQANRTCVLKCSQSPIPLYGTTSYRCVNATQCAALSLFGNNVTQLCSLCSGALPFGDPITKQCVYNCSATYYGNLGTNLCVLTCNFNLLLYADNYTQQCTTFCTLGTFGVNSSSTPICQKDCPSGSYALDSTRTCVANCGSGFFGDPLTGKCYNSSLLCSDGYYGNTVTNMCVLPASCQTITIHYYADNATKMCIVKCTAPNYGLNTSYTCIPKCPTNLYAENTTRMCLAVSGCGLYLSFADSQLNICVSQCSTTPVFTYSENVTYTCVTPANCPASMFAENVSQSCVYYCPHTSSTYTFADSSKTRRCVAICPDWYFGDISSGYGLCASVCPGAKYYRDDRSQNCVYVCPVANSSAGLLDTYGDINTDSCVETCPPGWFAQNEINRTCVQVCQAGTWGNTITRMCITNPVTSCPAGTWADNFTNLCVSFCTNNASNGQYFYGENITRLCIASCPIPSFAFNPTRVCIDICPYTIDSSPGYFGDPGTSPTRLCVTNCLTANLYRDTANNRTCQPSCTYNSSYKTYKDPTIMTCVASCPTYPQYLYAQGNSSSTATCASSCPSGQRMLESNMSCVSTCPTLLDPTTNKCVTLCPFSTSLNTVLYANLITNTCVTSANCPANTYASDDSLTCVSGCPTGTYISGKNCMVICPDGTYINPNNQSCVVSTSCPSNYYGNNQTGTCVAVCTNGTFSDQTTRMCLTQCYGSYYGDPLLGVCSTSCSNGLIKNNLTLTCVGSCSVGYFYSSASSSCVTSCPSGTFADSKNLLCVTRCSSDPMTFASTSPINACVTVCPASAQWFDLINRVCTATCPSLTYQYSLNMSCVSFCPPPYYLLGSACSLSCSSTSSYADDLSRKCVTTCPTGFFKDPTTYKCVVNCPVSPVQYYAQNTTKSCVTDCPSGYADIQKGMCVAVCSINPVFYAQPNSRKCVKLCPASYNEFADPVSQSCVTICPSGYYADNRERRCIQSCANIFYADSLTNPPACVATCTLTTYADPLLFKCVTSCSAGYYSYSGNSTCLQFCPYGYFADNSTGTCVQQCRNQSYQYADDYTHTCTNNCSNLQFAYLPSNLYYGTCLKFCPNGYFADPTTMNCVVKCPNGYFGNTNNNTCKTSCPENQFMDSINNLCQTSCPQAKALFGEPFSRKCVTNCSSTGYSFLFADSVNPSSRLCTAKCSGSQFGDPNTLTCVPASNCSLGLISDSYYKLCVQRCYNNTFASGGNCYAICPISGTYADQDTQSCVVPLNCTTGLFADPSKGACVQYCDIASNRYADTATRICLLNCISPLYADNITRTCAAVCTSIPQYYGLNSSRLCVQNCPNNTFGDPTNNLCVIKCANGSYGDKNTWTCVTMCPLTYFGDNSTNMCVSTCPSSPKYFGDPFALICVFNCSNGLFADPLNNRQCSKVCISPNFAQNSTKSCISNCLTGFADPNTRQCIANCSQNYYGYNFICYPDQCPSATPAVYADDTTNLCVPLCPSGYYGEPNSRKCVLVCPIAYNSFANTDTRLCVTSCPADTYADFSVRQCVSTCAAIPALFSTTQGGNLCVANCTNGLFSNNATRSCVSNCPNGTYADNQTYTCAAYCPTKPMMWADNLTNICVYTCSLTYDRYADNSSRICVINCPLGTFAQPLSRSCKTTCAFGYFGVNTTRRCQTVCPSFSFANTLNRMCVAVCPVDPISYGDPISKTCISSCPTGSYGNPLTQQCVYDVNNVSSCPVDYFSDITTQLCVQVCPMKFDLYAQPISRSCKASCVSPYIADNSTMRCVLVCPTYPSYFANLTTQRCVKYCPNGTYADNMTRKCVTTCPAGSYAENSTWRCVSYCPDNPRTLRDSVNWKCVQVCPTGYFANYFSLECVASCPASGKGFARNDTKECVKTCPNNSFAFLPTRTCVLSCYNNTYAEFNSRSCVSNCPRNPALFASDQNMSCVTSCPQDMFAYQNARTCVAACPGGFFRQNTTGYCVQFCKHGSNTFADNATGYCVSICTLGTFADPVTSKCVAKCPNPPLTYAENVTRTCVSKCPSNTFGQNKTRICVASCPTGSLSYPDSNLCVFECPIGFYAYKPTQFCVNQCSAPLYGDPSTRSCVPECPINQLLYADNSTRTCVLTCPKGSYAYQWAVACLPSCPKVNAPYVQTYAAEYDNTCTQQCDYPYFSYQPTRSCLAQCSDPYYNDVNLHSCQLCPTSCISCTSATSCKSCVLGFFLQQGQCIANCTLIYYANPSTRTCVVSTGCSPYYGVNSSRVCQSNCPNGQFPNSNAYRCDSCPSTCITCTSLRNCLNCITFSVMANNFCYGYCNITVNINANNSVADGMWFNSDNKTCTKTCPNGTYYSVVFCKLCSEECSSCVNTPTNCTNCTNGKYIIKNTCVSSCPDKYQPSISRACIFCNNTCGSPLTYTTNVTSINGQTSMFMNFNSAVDITGNLYQTFNVSSNGGKRLLVGGSNPGYQIVVIDSNTVQFIFPPGTSPTQYNVQIINPQNVVGPNGQLPNTLSATASVDANNIYSTSMDAVPSALPTYFTFLAIICVVSFVFDLELMRFLQLVYVHYFLVISYPPQLYKIFSALRFSTMYYLPKLFSVSKAVLHPKVPDTVYNAVGDYNFLRNAGFAFTPLLVILITWALLKFLSVPQINRFKTSRVWARNLLQKKFKFAILLEWVSMFITNTIFFAFLQLRDYAIYDTFTQVSIILAHIFIVVFVLVVILLTYRIVTFHNEHPQLSQNLKKASELILKDDQADQLVSSNIFLSEKKKIDLRDIFYPQINNQNIFPYRCLYKYNLLSLLCPSVIYTRAILLSVFIAIGSTSLQLQMGLCIPLNVLTLLYFSKTRPFTFKFRKYRIRNYVVLYHQAALIIFEFLLLVFGLKSSAGATSTQKEAYSYYIIYYLVAVCSISFIYHIFMIVVFIYRKIWLVFIESEFFAKNFPEMHAKNLSAKNKNKKLIKTIDPKAKESLKKLIKGYKKSKSALRPTEDDKANPNLPIKYKLTYFNRNQNTSMNSKTTLSKTQKKQMLKEIFGEKKEVVMDEKKYNDEFEEVRQNEFEPEFEQYEEEIEIKASELAKYVNDADHLLKMKQTEH